MDDLPCVNLKVIRVIHDECCRFGIRQLCCSPEVIVPFIIKC